MIQDFLRRIHQAEQRPAQHRGQDGKDHAQKTAEHNRVPDAAADFFFILRAESLRNGNGKPGAQPEAQADDQEIDGAGRADGSQAFRAEKTADDGGIHKAVQLLKQHTEQQRQRKGKNQFQGAAFRQVARQGPGHTN